MFNIALFKEQLKNNLDSFESKFLIRTFLYSSASFFSFGLLIIFLLLIDQQFNLLEKPVFAFFGMLISIVSLFWFFSCYTRYAQSPITTEQSHINKTYKLLIFSYIFGFLFLFNFASIQFGLTDIGSKSVFVALIFGSTFVIYLIPAAIGLYIQKHKTALSLMQFVKYCYAIYFALFIAFIFSILIGGLISNALSALLYIFLGIILFTSPIFTLYKLKRITPFIDYTDTSAVYKWELFFTLEILLQLLQLALYILRFVIQFVGPGNRK